jgi:hypothetical protein
MGWTVDSIATTLADLSEQVSHGHARLVDFLLEEADKKAQQPRHLSTVDTFASMPSIAIDSSITPPPDLETMAVKFKASRSPPGCKVASPRMLTPVCSNTAGNTASRKATGAALCTPCSASNPTRSLFRGIDSTTSRFARTYSL